MIRIGVDYYPEHWDKNWWKDDALEMARVGVNTVRLAEFSWGIIEPQENEFNFAWLDEVIEIFTSVGIDVILGTPTNCAPLWLYNAFPETLQMNRDGQRTPTGIRGHRCMTSSVYRIYVERVVTRMAERYAGNPSVIAWQLDNEPEGNHCCCPSCSAGFRAFVQKKYGSIEKVNLAWGTDVWSGQFSEWEQITPPLGTIYNYGWLNPAFLMDYERWASASCAEYINFQSSLIRKVRSDAVITVNACFQDNMPDFHALFAGMDVASYDNYPEVRLPENSNVLYSQAYALDLVRGFKRQNFWIMEQLSGPKGCWIPISPAPEPGMIHGYAWQALAHGADMILFFRWRTARKGAETYWHGLFNDRRPSGRRYEEFERFLQSVQELPELDSTRTKSRVAILYSSEQERAFRIQQQSDGFSYREQLWHWHDGFTSLGINVDVICADEPLDGYQIVVAPTQYVTDEALVSRLQNFAQKGGSLVLTNRSGVMDSTHSRITEPLPNAFRTLCGCVVKDYDPIGNIEQKIRTETGETFSVTRWCDILEPEGAASYAKYDDSFYSGRSAISVNTVGAGRCMYVGTVGRRDLYRSLAKELMSHAGLDFYKDLPSGVEICTRENDRVTLTFVFNNTGTEQNFMLDDKPCSLAPFEMKIEKKFR